MYTYRFFLLVNTSLGLGDGPLQTHGLIEIGDVDCTVDMEQLLVVDLSIPEPCSNVLHLRLCGVYTWFARENVICWAIRNLVISCHGPESRKKKFEAKKRELSAARSDGSGWGQVCWKNRKSWESESTIPGQMNDF